MIEWLRIRNFQGIGIARLDFSKGLNVIVGSSDAGKSSIIRALRWIDSNEPSGTNFIQHGQKVCSVSMGVNGHTIVRKRSASINQYKLDDETFENFGTGVPDKVKDTIGLDPIAIQGQFDGPFLLSQTSGEIGRMLNSLANLEEIDTTITNINRIANREKQESERIKANIIEEQSTLKALNWVDSAWYDYETIKINQQHANMFRRNFIAVSQSVAKAKNILETIEIEKTKIVFSKEADSIDSLITSHKEGNHAYERLYRKITQIKEIRQTIETCSKTAEGIKPVNEVFLTCSDLNEVEKRADRLESLIQKIETTQQIIKQSNDKAKRLKEEYQKWSPKECPLCGSKIQNAEFQI